MTYIILHFEKFVLKWSGPTFVKHFFDRFEALAQRMESLVQGNSREMVDTAYKKLVSLVQGNSRIT